MTEKSGFDPLTLTESNATSYPAPFREANANRWFRRLGDHAGLKNFGVNLVRIVPGGQSSARHAHKTQDEFIYVLEGEVELVTNAGPETLRAGQCAGFPAGTGNAHHFVNRSGCDVMLLVIGDRSPGEEGIYPDIDLQAKTDADGKWHYYRKDGTPY